MAKCIICGKKGLFLKTNQAGRCELCEYNYQQEQLKKRRAEAEQAKIEQQQENAKRMAAEKYYNSICEMFSLISKTFEIDEDSAKRSADIQEINKLIDICTDLFNLVDNYIDYPYIDEIILNDVTYKTESDKRIHWGYINAFDIKIWTGITFSISKIFEEIKQKVQNQQYTLEHVKTRIINYEHEPKYDLINIDTCINNLSLVPMCSAGEKVALKTCDELPKIRYSRISAKTEADSISTFIAIDIETTGLSCRSNIIEISAVKFINFIPTEAFSTLCKCNSIPDEITQLTGINKEMVSKMPFFYQILPSLQAYIASYNLVGHNLPFDLDCLMVRGLDVVSQKRKFYDTLAIARATISKVTAGNFKLDSLLQIHNISRSTAHRSLSDATATGFLFEALHKDYKLRALHGMDEKL